MPPYKEAAFKTSYRKAQVQIIMTAIAHRRSIAVLGLAGMGKSNLFRFLVSQRQVRQSYLGRAADKFDFVFVDCNLAGISPEALLCELSEQLARSGVGAAEPATTVS
jgi:hypothetical protein